MSYQADIWRAIRARPKGISIQALAGDTGASLKSARHYVYALLGAGVLEVSETLPDHARRFRLVKDPGPVPPRHDGQQLITTPTARYRVWQAARVLVTYTVSDLMATAECTKTPARQIVTDLERVGYARVIKPAARRPIASPARYRLLRNTGPLPLTRHSDGRITDPNTNEVFHP